MTTAADLPEHRAVALRDMIARRTISPLEQMDACIARIEAFNPAINAMAATDFERARTAARAAEDAVMRGDTLGPLHGPWTMRARTPQGYSVRRFAVRQHHGMNQVADAAPMRKKR